MNELIGRVFRFQKDDFPQQSALYGQLAANGQDPSALMISCADSRVVPEHILQAAPGDLFVCRNAGNLVPPFGLENGGVAATVEFAMTTLHIRDIIVCGHSECGAMKGLAGDPAKLSAMPDVAAWLRHGAAARHAVNECHPELDGAERLRALTLENVKAQLAHLRTYPSVAAAIAKGAVSLHGWVFEIGTGQVLALDGATGSFRAIEEGKPLPVALPAAPRRAALPLDVAA